MHSYFVLSVIIYFDAQVVLDLVGRRTPSHLVLVPFSKFQLLSKPLLILRFPEIFWFIPYASCLCYQSAISPRSINPFYLGMLL